MLTQAERGELLTVKEVAARLRVHPMTVRRMIADGRIPAVRFGGPRSAIRVDECELAQWLYDEGGE
jgi:excisionase family DNA binding protein